MMFHDDEVQELYLGESDRGGVLRKDPESGVWSDEAEEDFGDGFSGFELRPSGDRYESDRYDPENLDGDEAAGWIAYHEGRDRDEFASEAWLVGYDLAASSDREPYALTQERMRLQELRDELGTVEEFLADVQERLAEADISQAELARRMGLFPTQLSRWFNGRVGMELESMLAMRDALERLETDAGIESLQMEAGE